ncbi:MAG: DUF4382 domain-containing protein [Candidatus Eiseniibacteriota bacterium]
MKLRLAAGLLALFCAFVLVSCSGNPSSPGMGRVSILLTDAPGDFEAVNLVVREVSVHRIGTAEFDDDEDGDDGEDDGTESDTTDTDTTDIDLPDPRPGGWEVLTDEEQTFDLLALRNGVTTTLGTALVPAGRYTQIRLLLGEGSNVVVDGVTHPLVIPSGLQTGLKLVGGFNVPEGETVELTVDIDAAQSVHVGPNGTYRLRPTAKLLDPREDDTP